MSGEPDLDRVLGHFEFFAASVEALPLYSRLVRGIANDPEVAALLLDAQPGQARPVLLLAAAHFLVLSDPSVEVARWYGSVSAFDEFPSGDPYPAFRDLCLGNSDEMRELIASHRTQTNEVNRVAMLAPMIAFACADLPDQPMSIVELGASAGLLLGLERYRIDVGGALSGDVGSPVHLAADVPTSGEPPTWEHPPTPPIVDRVGIDLEPVSLTDVDAVRWLEACIWPDQPLRVERFRAATALMRRDMPRLVAGDMLDRLPDVACSQPPDTHLVLFDGWAVTYVERSRRYELAAAIASLAADGRPVSWLSMEAPRCVPEVPVPPVPAGLHVASPETVLGVRRWRSGRELAPLALGWGHPHGTWLTWQV